MSASRRPPLFVYPSLPKWEIRIYITVTIVAILYAWKCVYSASNKYTFKFGDLASISDLPIFGRRFKDETDWEWSRWSPLALRNIPHLIIYSIVFNFSERFLSEKQWVLITTAISMFSVSQIYTIPLLLLSLIQGVFIFVVSEYFRKPLAVWMSSLPILYVVMNHTDLFSADPFLVLLFVSYSLLSYISFNLEITGGFRRQEDITATDRFVRMLFYTFYQPYLISLIVLYPDFERQIANRSNRSRDWAVILKLGIRIAFWWILLEFMLHFFYFGSMLSDTAFAQSLPKNEFVTLGMAICNFFHWKYVIIFGVPSVFAMIDGMEPKDGPICIARIALISKVWRYFDRGLYEFFKKYIFVPICFPSFSLGRKIIGLFVSYTFVLLWHGFLYHNVVWIGLNIVELLIEYGAKGFYSIEGIQKWRETNISDRNFRRILGWLQIIPFAFGLYSNFFFLGGSKIGSMFVQRIFWEETVPIRWPFLLLISIGYNYMEVTMEAERYLSTKCPLKHKTK